MEKNKKDKETGKPKKPSKEKERESNPKDSSRKLASSLNEMGNTIPVKDPNIADSLISGDDFAAGDQPHQIRNCYHHSMILTLYCDHCDEPVCDQCTIVGPHNTQVGGFDPRCTRSAT